MGASALRPNRLPTLWRQVDPTKSDGPAGTDPSRSSRVSVSSLIHAIGNFLQLRAQASTEVEVLPASVTSRPCAECTPNDGPTRREEIQTTMSFAKQSEPKLVAPPSDIGTVLSLLHGAFHDGEYRKKTRATVLIDVEAFDRARNAVVALSGPPHRMTLSRFAADAFYLYARALEAAYNSGKVFEVRKTGLHGGRPLSAPKSKTGPRLKAQASRLI